MEEKNLSYEELSELMKRLDEAVKMSERKQGKISKRENKLHEETRPLFVKEGLEEIEKLKADKKEFDEMTGDSLAIAKKQIQEIRETLEKDYQNMLVDVLKRRQQVETKLQSMKEKGLEDEKLEWANTSAKNEMEKINKELSEFQSKHFEKMNDLDKYEQEVVEFAMKIGMEDKLKMVEKATKEFEETKTPEPAGTKKPEPKAPEPAEAKKPEPKAPEPAEAKKPEPKAPEPGGTKKPEPKAPEPAGTKKPEPRRIVTTKIKSVVFTTENNIPSYIITVSDGKGNEITYKNEGFECLARLSKEQATELKNRGIEDAEKYYDLGLVNTLAEVDKIYGTSGVKQYEQQIKDKYIKGSTAILDIDYDFSGLYQMPNIVKQQDEIEQEGDPEKIADFKRNNDKAKLEALKKLANKSKKIGLVTYERRPNPFKRLLNRIKTLKLRDRNAEANTPVSTGTNSTEPKAPEEIEAEVEEIGSEKWISEMYEQYMNEKDSRGFSAHRFESQIMSIEGVSLDAKKALMKKINDATPKTKVEQFKAKYQNTTGDKQPESGKDNSNELEKGKVPAKPAEEMEKY